MERAPIQIRYKYKSRYVEKTIQLPMIFITNCLNVFGIQDGPQNHSIFNDDDDYYHKGLRERIKIISADKNIFCNGNLIFELTNEYVCSTIKFTAPQFKNNVTEMISNDFFCSSDIAI